jgi:SAM-dependent methyltransferase
VKKTLLPYLCCPSCKGKLTLRGDLESGALACRACAVDYPIERGVPNFVPASDFASVQQTTSGFAKNWPQYNELILKNETLNESLFREWISPVPPEMFAEQVVLEAGCGMGRWLRVAAKQNPKVIIGFDYSEIAYTAHENTQDLDNVHVVRADIFHPPFPSIFDHVYSLGVVHHTSDPARAHLSLSTLINEHGSILTWVYGREGNDWIIHCLNPFRKHVTSRLPHPALNSLTTAMAVTLFAASKVYTALPAAISDKLFYSDYIRHLNQYPYTYMEHIVYDHLVPELAEYVPEREVLQWGKDAGLAHATIQRNSNSWKLIAARTDDDLRALGVEPMGHAPPAKATARPRAARAARPKARAAR